MKKEKTISATDANRKFFQILSAVRGGHSHIVTFRGKPVAKIIPVGGSDNVRSAAQAILLARLRSQRVRNVGAWVRDELYENKP